MPANAPTTPATPWPRLLRLTPTTTAMIHRIVSGASRGATLSIFFSTAGTHRQSIRPATTGPTTITIKSQAVCHRSTCVVLRRQTYIATGTTTGETSVETVVRLTE